MADDLVGSPLLHDLAGIHHDHAISDLLHDAKVVRDQKDGHPELLLQVAQKFENLRLDRDIKRGGGLIGNEELGTRGDGHGDHDALLHTAGHLVRIGTRTDFRGGNSDEIKQTDHLGVGGVRGLMKLERLHDLLADTEDRIQCSTGLLENIIDDSTTNGAKFAFVHPQDVAPINKEGALLVKSRRARQKASDGHCSHGLSAATFPDQTNRFSFSD